jgi:hypothetical protein
MAGKHPYISGSGSLIQAVTHLRNSFPGTITADTLKKLGMAPNNESYLINILRFVDVIDEDGTKTKTAATVFSKHEDSEFQEGFQKMVKAAYSELFELHGDDAWKLDQAKLISFFRTKDESSAIVGQRQATTFQALALLCGFDAAAPTRKGPSVGARRAPTKVLRKSPAREGAGAPTVPDTPPKNGRDRGRDIGLTVRIEINLPAEGDQATYDRIFKSIRENFIDAQ